MNRILTMSRNMKMNGYYKKNSENSDRVAAMQVFYKNIQTGLNTTELTFYSTRLNILMRQ